MNDPGPYYMDPIELLEECRFGFIEEEYKKECDENVGNDTLSDEEEMEKTLHCALKRKVVKYSPAVRKHMKEDNDVILPIGWDRMEKDEMIAAFIQVNKGKEIPQYILSNLRESSNEAEKFQRTKKKVKVSIID